MKILATARICRYFHLAPRIATMMSTTSASSVTTPLPSTSSPVPSSSTFSFKGKEYRLYGWNIDVDSTKTRNASPSSSPSAAHPRALIVLYHGFFTHARYPTIRYAAEFLSSQHNNKYAVVTADLPGHGESPGLRGYLNSADDVIDYGMAVAQHAKNLIRQQQGDCRLFIMGNSLGGNVAFQVARHLGPSVVDGAILMVPMLKLHVQVSPFKQSLLRLLSYAVPSMPVIPHKGSAPDELLFRDVQKRKECQEDAFVIYRDYLPPATAVTCIDLANKAQAELAQLSCPFLLLIANEEYMVDNQGSLDLYEQSVSTDKTMKRYDALHELMAEPSPLVDEIQHDILTWLNERSK